MKTELRDRAHIVALVVSLCLVLASDMAHAKVMGLSITELTEQSDRVVLAKVKSVRRTFLGKRHAEAEIVETWKGEAGETVTFLASPTWTCDISDAEVGERVVLFLKWSETRRVWEIVHSGRGRFLLKERQGTQYACWWWEVLADAELKAEVEALPELPNMTCVPLGVLRKHIQDLVVNVPAEGAANQAAGRLRETLA